MQAVSSSVISSRVLIIRASCISCWPSTTSIPARCSANRTTGSTTSTPTGSPSRPRCSSDRRIFSATSSARPDCGDIAPRIVEIPAGRAALQPRAVDLVVARGRAEVPHHRVIALREQAEARELVHRPGTDVGRGDVADVGHVEAQQCADVGLREQPLDPLQALACAASRCRRAAPSRRWSVRMSCPFLSTLCSRLQARASRRHSFSRGPLGCRHEHGDDDRRAVRHRRPGRRHDRAARAAQAGPRTGRGAGARALLRRQPDRRARAGGTQLQPALRARRARSGRRRGDRRGRRGRGPRSHRRARVAVPVPVAAPAGRRSSVDRAARRAGGGAAPRRPARARRRVWASPR